MPDDFQKDILKNAILFLIRLHGHAHHKAKLVGGGVGAEEGRGIVGPAGVPDHAQRIGRVLQGDNVFGQNKRALAQKLIIFQICAGGKIRSAPGACRVRRVNFKEFKPLGRTQLYRVQNAFCGCRCRFSHDGLFFLGLGCDV